MRGTARRAESITAIDPRSFSWERVVLAVLRHSTLPFDETLEATPLDALDGIGVRDRLSLTGQFAAHIAFLQFAGIRDGAFDRSHWAVVRKRGVDWRLIRTRSGGDEEIPPLTSIQEFASAVGLPALDTLRRSWARADVVYQEIESKLRSDAIADLRWLRASASGCIASPGIDGLRTLLAQTNGRFHSADELCSASLKRCGPPVVVIGEAASPLERTSAIRAVEALIGPIDRLNEHEAVERLLAAPARSVFVLTRTESFDEFSRRVVDLLLASNAGVWVGKEGTRLPDSTWFVISPHLEARRELEARLGSMPVASRRGWIESLTDSPALTRYLDDGELPANGTLSEIREPLRSYLGAVALLGSRIPVALVDRLLERLQATTRAADLLFPGISSIEDGKFVFLSDDAPLVSQPSLHKLAAELLETSEFESAAEAIRTLRRLPASALTPPLRQRLAGALVECGRYVDARQLEPGEPLLARIERRMGDYAPALARLERLPQRDFDSELLRAELLQLTGRSEQASAILARCDPSTDEERVRLGYQRAVLALDSGQPPSLGWLTLRSPSVDSYAARFGVYRSIAAQDLESALVSARDAVAFARSIPERIDATLDLLFTLFCRGSWADARTAALDALLLVDETQGDRGAGGILFLLAYLAADDGQCGHAAHLLDRLRRFYGHTRDEQRLRELELLTAQIEFAHGRFDAARSAGEQVLRAAMPDQIREAAALILDESDWIGGCEGPLRSAGATANAGLTDRHILLRARRGLGHAAPGGAFAAALLEWEQRGGPPPPARSGSEKGMLFRAALGRGRSDLAASLAHELKIDIESNRPSKETELRILRSALTAQFPFEKHDLGSASWRYASRNRLGAWQQIGSAGPLPGAELDRILTERTADWAACSDHELLYIAGLDGWSSESREAIAALVRMRAEHFRLRRLIEDDVAPVTHETVEGIVGESEPIRELCSMIPRIAKRDVPVCILGESGTGKELVARAIHRLSPRRHKPFTPVNCAALPENLIESELFGHVRGAFTGADRDRPGIVETSDGGVLFLDEIGEMPAVAQAKLLRFLQEGEFRRVGETSNRSADLRVLAATNRKLEAAVEQGRFREDLYYRIRGLEIVVPPLRERGADIALLAAHFLAVEQRKHRAGPVRLSEEAEAAMASYHWPGNVRELQNSIRAAHLLAGEAREIDLEHLPERIRGIRIVRKPLGSYQDAVARFRRDLIERSLVQANGNQNQAAAMLKISRQALAYQIRELGILVNPQKRPRT